MDYLKIGQAGELTGKDRKLYRVLEILPGFLTWFTLLGLIILSYFYPIFVAFFIIAFDVYWLLLVLYLGIHLIVSYKKMKHAIKVDWVMKVKGLKPRKFKLINKETGNVNYKILKWNDMVHLVIFPIAFESLEIIENSIKTIALGKYPVENIIISLTVEERGGEDVYQSAKLMRERYGDKFKYFHITKHPDGIIGELKGKGANQSWGAEQVKKEIIDREQIDYDKILVSVFDIDTVIYPQYFYCLTYKFFTIKNPYRVSYQPVPVYHNNVWQAPFFARVAASSNTFWQMMQQLRHEKLATYSSHSMTWRALVDIGFWSKTMVSEDSRIFWHCFCYYDGDYSTVPLYYPVSMDVTMDETWRETAKNLYKQQRRWGWGVENVPYLIFNAIKRWHKIKKGRIISRIFVQIYGFHSWATNALIIAVIGWMPMLLGGDRFNATVLSTNLPVVTRVLMMMAMGGLVLSAIISTLLLPARPKGYGFFKNSMIALQWIILPISIIIFGAIPGLEAQTRLMINKRLGFFVTPKKR